MNVIKLHQELEDAGIPIHGVSSDGRIHFKEEASAAQITEAERIVQDHDPELSTAEQRREAYCNAFTLEAFIDAYLAAEFEGDRTKLEALQAKRAAIQQQYPEA